jgi:ribose transport system substrate-binding protein
MARSVDAECSVETAFPAASSRMPPVRSEGRGLSLGGPLGASDHGVIFVGIDGLGGPGGGIQKVKDRIVAATFVYPLCVDKAVEIGSCIMRDRDFRPQKTYTMESIMIVPDNAAQMYNRFTVE